MWYLEPLRLVRRAWVLTGTSVSTRWVPVLALVAGAACRPPAAAPAGTANPSPVSLRADGSPVLRRSPYLGVQFVQDGQVLPLVAAAQANWTSEVLAVTIRPKPFYLRVAQQAAVLPSNPAAGVGVRVSGNDVAFRTKIAGARLSEAAWALGFDDVHLRSKTSGELWVSDIVPKGERPQLSNHLGTHDNSPQYATDGTMAFLVSALPRMGSAGDALVNGSVLYLTVVDAATLLQGVRVAEDLGDNAQVKGDRDIARRELELIKIEVKE